MKVELDYFKPTGKYYSSGTYETSKKDIMSIVEEVKEFHRNKSLPDLIGNHSDYLVLIDVPDHENNFPNLIVP